MPIRQLGDAGAQSTVTGAITAVQTSVTLVSATGFPAILSGGQESVIILDSGNPAYSANSPLATPYEYQPVNTIVGNVLTFGLGGGAASRAAYAGTTNHAYFAGGTVALASLAEDFVGSVPWKFDEQFPSGVTAIAIPPSGTIPSSYLGVPYRHIQIEWVARTSVASNADVYIQYNGDGTANYSYQQLFGTANAVTYANPTAAVTAGNIGQVPGSPSGTGFGSGSVKINHFASVLVQKIARGDSSYIAASVSTSLELRRTMYWNQSGSAITSISFGLSTGNFVAGSLVTTYLLP
jgi:hypothetical protein